MIYDFECFFNVYKQNSINQVVVDIHKAIICRNRSAIFVGKDESVIGVLKLMNRRLGCLLLFINNLLESTCNC